MISGKFCAIFFGCCSAVAMANEAAGSHLAPVQQNARQDPLLTFSDFVQHHFFPHKSAAHSADTKLRELLLPATQDTPAPQHESGSALKDRDPTKPTTVNLGQQVFENWKMRELNAPSNSYDRHGKPGAQSTPGLARGYTEGSAIDRSNRSRTSSSGFDPGAARRLAEELERGYEKRKRE